MTARGAHAPGTWITDSCLRDGNAMTQVRTETGGTIDCRMAGPTIDASVEIARFIAAAPETAAQRDQLLSALKALLAVYEITGDHKHALGSDPGDCVACEARAAIARAKGAV